MPIGMLQRVQMATKRGAEPNGRGDGPSAASAIVLGLMSRLRSNRGKALVIGGATLLSAAVAVLVIRALNTFGDHTTCCANSRRRPRLIGWKPPQTSKGSRPKPTTGRDTT